MTDGEQAARVRLRHALDLLDAHVASMKSHLEADIPTAGVRQGLVTAACAVTELAAIIDAFRYEREQAERLGRHDPTS